MSFTSEDFASLRADLQERRRRENEKLDRELEELEEKARKKEEARKAEEARRVAVVKRAEEARRAAEAKKAEMKRVEEEKRKAKQARKKEEEEAALDSMAEEKPPTEALTALFGQVTCDTCLKRGTECKWDFSRWTSRACITCARARYACPVKGVGVVQRAAQWNTEAWQYALKNGMVSPKEMEGGDKEDEEATLAMLVHSPQQVNSLPLVKPFPTVKPFPAVKATTVPFSFKNHKPYITVPHTEGVSQLVRKRKAPVELDDVLREVKKLRMEQEDMFKDVDTRLQVLTQLVELVASKAGVYMDPSSPQTTAADDISVV
ncbi:hypothetical protein FRB91_001804 [Serendipita sp. 411]|nr:hypothetical protein FRB91_001804 [Serendipita sp. 411]